MRFPNLFHVFSSIVSKWWERVLADQDSVFGRIRTAPYYVGQWYNHALWRVFGEYALESEIPKNVWVQFVAYMALVLLIILFHQRIFLPWLNRGIPGMAEHPEARLKPTQRRTLAEFRVRHPGVPAWSEAAVNRVGEQLAHILAQTKKNYRHADFEAYIQDIIPLCFVPTERILAGLRELHDNRPWWKKLFGWGTVSIASQLRKEYRQLF